MALWHIVMDASTTTPAASAAIRPMLLRVGRLGDEAIEILEGKVDQVVDLVDGR